MTDKWHKTENDTEAEEFTSDFWTRHREELQAGEFWADRIKSLRGEPVKRLKLALENLPLPASFREAAIATRALIKEKRKNNQNYEEELALLYWLAAINSFSVPYSEVLQEPGYNVIESIPGKKLKELPFTYQELGYEQLELLNKIDTKWLIEAWGNPKAHSTLHKIHNNVWSEYEQKLKSKRNKREKEFIQSISESQSLPEIEVPPTNQPGSNLGIILFVIAIVVFIVLVL
nr:putative uncharacterized protein [uncultured bacterium]